MLEEDKNDIAINKSDLDESILLEDLIDEPFSTTPAKKKEK